MRWSVLAGGAALFAAAGCCRLCRRQRQRRGQQASRMAPISFNEIPGWNEDTPGRGAGRLPPVLPQADRRARHQDRHRWRREDVTRPNGRRICDSAAAIKERDTARRAQLLRGEFPAAGRAGAGQVHRLFRARAARQPRAVARCSPCRSIAGRPISRDKPYCTRAEIEQGVLKGKGLEIAWVQDPVALFEVQVQGSGRIHLAEGGVLSLGFDGSNNRPYTAIGGVLADMGVMQRDEATWPAIRDWLKRNPQQGREVMRKNERYIFFKDTRTAAAGRLEGVPLTAQRSLAIDVAFTPYGTPIWIDTQRPVAGKPGPLEIYRRLMIAQDSGAAIKGPARGDVFFGGGAQAADWAGRMVGGGRAIVLVPNRG